MCCICSLMSSHQRHLLQTVLHPMRAHAYKILSALIFSFQLSRHVRIMGVGWPACLLAPSPTALSGPQTGAPAPTAAAQVSPPAPPTGTGRVSCRPRPDSAKSGHAKVCCPGSKGCNRSVDNQHMLSKVPPNNMCILRNFQYKLTLSKIRGKS